MSLHISCTVASAHFPRNFMEIACLLTTLVKGERSNRIESVCVVACMNLLL